MMNTLEVALNLGLNVEVSIPVTKENLNQLNELVEIINEIYEDNITKSGLSHRLRKIKELATHFENTNKIENTEN